MPSAQLLDAARQVASRVEAAMRQDLEQALADQAPLLHEVLSYALFSGGKRIRPLLAVLASRCCGRDDAEAYRLATAFEYLHVASLLHDDIIDHAATRRGQAATAHRFGLTPALLAGDWLLARSMQLIARLSGPAGLDLFCRATTEMVNGEFAQLRLTANIEASEAAYFAVIQQKTGNLIASACAIGALFAGAEQSHIEALRRYGQQLGLAFQVADDLLDYLGASQETGKAKGNDFIEGKMTLPLIRALKQATAQERQEIAELIQEDRSQLTAQARIHAFIKEKGGFASAAQSAQHCAQEAKQALTLLPQTPAGSEAIDVLRQLADYVVQRKK